MSSFSRPPEPSTSAKGLINLLRGWPSPSLLPASLFEKATHNVLINPAIADPALLYGLDEGDPRLRTNLAQWLTTFYQPADPVTAARLAITGGASQSLANILQVFTDPLYTRNIWLVAPTYMLAFRTFEDNGFAKKLRAVPEDHQGIDIDYLTREMAKSEERARHNGNDAPQCKPARPWGKYYKHVIYCVPSFSNPSSKTMSLGRREELVKLARHFDALIIADDVYDFLQWPSSLQEQEPALCLRRASLPRVVDVDRYLDGGATRAGTDGFGSSLSNGSFSKICAPGLRTGWVEASEKFCAGVAQAGSTSSGGAPSQATATFIAELLGSGELQRHVYETLQPNYCRRYRHMMMAINKKLVPLGVRFPQSDRDTIGGYFVWLTLPHPLKAADVAPRARIQENLVVAQGEIFEVPGDPNTISFEQDIRLCFAWEDINLLEEGIERLASVVRVMLDEQKEGGCYTLHLSYEQSPPDDYW